MTWINENWVVVLLGVGFIAFHVLGHRGHSGRHGGHGHRPDPALPPEPTSIPPSSVPLASGPDAVTDEYARPLATDGYITFPGTHAYTIDLQISRPDSATVTRMRFAYAHGGT